jgi:CheY-like chemotaxis protein
MSVERWSPAFADCPLRVLVVDNCKDTADSLTSLVKLWGYDVEVAYDGETAITTALVYRPDVIFLDLAMPSMSGCEIVKRLRGEEGVKDAVMVAVTGYADQTHRQQAMEAGFDLYLVKPVDPVVLRDVLVRSEKKEGGSDHAIREV